MAELDKVKKGLECLARKQEPMANPCSKCDYHDRPNFAFCVVDVATDALAMLKEQPEIVRCKDCKWYSEKGFCKHPNGGAGNIRPADWFCADGVAKDKTVLNK